MGKMRKEEPEVNHKEEIKMLKKQKVGKQKLENLQEGKKTIRDLNQGQQKNHQIKKEVKGAKKKRKRKLKEVKEEKRIKVIETKALIKVRLMQKEIKMKRVTLHNLRKEASD